MVLTLKKLFDACNRGPWVTAGENVQYRIQKGDGYSIVVFQPTVGLSDWLINFCAWVKPYRDMKEKWRAHAGYIKAYKSVQKELMAALEGEKRIILAGYSQGGAIATLLHEDLAYNRPEADVATFAFGAPRVVWLSKAARNRFDGLLRVSHARDIVTKLPFWVLGYRHVGGLLRFGRGGFPWHKYHRPEAYRDVPEMGIPAVTWGEA